MNKHVKGTLAVLGVLASISVFIMITYLGWMLYLFLGAIGILALYFVGLALGAIYFWGMELGKEDSVSGSAYPVPEKLKVRKKPSTRKKWKIVLPNPMKAPTEKSKHTGIVK